MTHFAAIVAIAAYVASALLMIAQLWPSHAGGRTRAGALVTFGLGLVAHTVTLVAVILDGRMVFLDNGADYFFWVSWGVAVAFAVAWRKLSYPIIGAFLIPAIVLFMSSSSYLLHKESTSIIAAQRPESGDGFLLSLLHGVPALVSVISLALAFVVSAVFIITERRLKRKKMQALDMSGPNLQFLDSLNRQLVQTGFVAISLVVLTGGLWAVSSQRSMLSTDTSVISGLVMWVLLAFILHVRLVLKWSPKRVSILTVLATGVFFISVFAVMIVAGRLTHANIL